MNIYKNKAKGFTIVELLIVIVVIAILAAIVIVAYQGIQNKARATQYQTDAVSIVKKFEAYNAVSNGYPLTAAGADAATVTTQTTAGANLTTLVNGTTESKLPSTLSIFAVVPFATVPTYAQTMTAVNASAASDSYFVAYCTTGKGMRIYYPDGVSAVKSTDVGVCP
jgi:prepilin-type N-terminal cleavage/methylation domain-containing protein